MKRLLCVCVILLCLVGTSSADGLVLQATGGACTPAYGTEYHVSANAALPSVSDTNATTGFTTIGLITWASETGSPQLGTYHIHGVANADTERFYYDMTGLGLTAGNLYRMTFYWRHDGTGGDWRCGLSSISSAMTGNNVFGTVTSANTTYAQIDRFFYYQPDNASYLIFQENSATDDGGVFLDNFSITAVTTPCFGSEINTTANAISIGNEANATTGWTNTGSTFASTSSGTPANGTYHLLSEANTTPTAGARASFDLSSLSLSNSTRYVMYFSIKHVGTGDVWSVGLNNDGGTSGTSEEINIDNTETTHRIVGWEFIYDSTLMRYLVINEDGAANTGGVYLDALSIKTIVSR